MRFEWPGFNDKGTVVIATSPGSFYLAAEAVDIDGERFVAKEELHVTLIGSKLGTILQKKIACDGVIETTIKKYFESIDWSYQETGPLHFLSRIEKGTVQKSVIMLIDMPGLTTFYQQLQSQDIIPEQTTVPPAHVTLYTHNCPLGIAVPSQRMLDMLTYKTMPVKALETLCR